MIFLYDFSNRGGLSFVKSKSSFLLRFLRTSWIPFQGAELHVLHALAPKPGLSRQSCAFPGGLLAPSSGLSSSCSFTSFAHQNQFIPLGHPRREQQNNGALQTGSQTVCGLFSWMAGQLLLVWAVCILVSFAAREELEAAGQLSLRLGTRWKGCSR